MSCRNKDAVEIEDLAMQSKLLYANNQKANSFFENLLRTRRTK